MPGEIEKSLLELDETSVLDAVKSNLQSGVSAVDVIEELRKGMEKIGDKFGAGEMYLSELIMSASIFQNAMEIIKPSLAAGSQGITGKVVIGTVLGDVHDLGKNIVVALLESEGFEVFDLGTDVPPETFVKACIDHNPQIVGMSGFLLVAFESMQKTVEALVNAGVRDNVKIIIGGGVTDDVWRQRLGVDAWAKDAAEGVKICKSLVRGVA